MQPLTGWPNLFIIKVQRLVAFDESYTLYLTFFLRKIIFFINIKLLIYRFITLQTQRYFHCHIIPKHLTMLERQDHHLF